MTKPPKDSTFSVSDSTDWLPTPLSTLAPVDAALRCQVCKDFYTTPMITSCAHTFCSLCIRRCLANDGKCPACRTPDQELKLRNNGVMEDLVDAFVRARSQVLEFARKPQMVVGERERGGTPKRKRDVMVDGEEDESPKKRTRSQFRRPATRDNNIVILDSEEEGEGDEDYIPEDGLVECPICSKRMKDTAINPHLDRDCKDPEEPKVSKALGRNNSKPASSQQTQNLTKRPERLPQINYSMVKDTSLRKKMLDLGISASGSRQTMEKRYTEWITLWNANCDAKAPKSKSELKRELDVWERAQGGKMFGGNKEGEKIKDKDFDGKAWSNTHDDDFKKLIANARKKRTIPSSKPETPDSASTSTEPATPSAAPILPFSETENTPVPAAGNPELEEAETPRPEAMNLDPSPHKTPTSTHSQRRFFDEKKSGGDEYDLPTLHEQSPSKAPTSSRRFFEEEGKERDPHELPPSSQMSRGVA